jgi:hypothetical protein
MEEACEDGGVRGWMRARMETCEDGDVRGWRRARMEV